MAAPSPEPPRDCPLCPRLEALREELRAAHPDWWNAPVPARGDPAAWLAIVGLAPGRSGANRTGRAFDGDPAGDLLAVALVQAGIGERDAMIVNAVRCVPPGNKPLPVEIHACRAFLASGLAAMPGLRVAVALGEIAHQSAVKALGGKLPKARFAHGAEHRLPSGVVVLDSFHPSRLNQNVGRLTAEMLAAVLARAVALGRPG
jgi:uracil-DNA glycosylase